MHICVFSINFYCFIGCGEVTLPHLPPREERHPQHTTEGFRVHGSQLHSLHQRGGPPELEAEEGRGCFFKVVQIILTHFILCSSNKS